MIGIVYYLTEQYEAAEGTARQHEGAIHEVEPLDDDTEFYVEFFRGGRAVRATMSVIGGVTTDSRQVSLDFRV